MEFGAYEKKPIKITAVQIPFNPSDIHTIVTWMEDCGYPYLIGDATQPETLRYPGQAEGDDTKPEKGIYIDPEFGGLMIRTLEGDMMARVGDWIIRGVQGEFYPCKPDIFEATYKKVD